MREFTCGNCKSLHLGCDRFHVAGCKETGFVVPHGMDNTGDVAKFEFWRVPISCPRPDSEVVKSEKQAKRKDWVKVSK